LGFGASSEEKARSSQIGDLTKELFGFADKQNKRSNKAFKLFQKSAKPVKDFYTDILKGDRDAINELLGPEISRIKSGYDNERMRLAEFMPRGGAKASGNINLNTNEMTDVNNLALKARPMAAEGLSNLLPIFGSTAQGFSGLSLGANQQGTGNLFGLNQEAAQNRATKAQFWGDIGAGVGGIAGAAAGNPGNACCFIFLEALNGELPDYVRELRDYYYEKEPLIAKGYKRLATKLVPLMKRSKLIKKLVNLIMVRPIVNYGAYVKGLPNGNRYNIIFKLFWFKFWKLIGTI
jgi:hypothetical protein